MACETGKRRVVASPAVCLNKATIHPKQEKLGKGTRNSFKYGTYLEQAQGTARKLLFNFLGFLSSILLSGIYVKG